MQIPTISAQAAKASFDQGTTIFVDVRDPHSFAHGHIPGAQAVGDHNVEDFIEQADKSKPHIIYCYHGHSSQGGTAYFLENGFLDVKSMDGGFTDWQQLFPEAVEAGRT